MALHLTTATAERKSGHTMGRDTLMAVLLALLALVPALADGTAFNWPNDNDSAMRIVQIRDLLAGQGWFDYFQYRMGPDGGFEMHWSRIVDLPVAAIIVLVQAISGSTAHGEWAAGIVWPTMLLAVAILSVMRSARIVGGDQAMFPATLIGLMSLYSIGIFAPGAFDHHNMQLTLCLLAMWMLLAGSGWRSGAAAGGWMALTLATGMETLPLVAAAGLCVAAIFYWNGRESAGLVAGFGLGFGAGAATTYAATVGWQNWFVAHCDAFSMAQLSVAIVGGLGLTAIAAVPAAGTSLRSRAWSLAVLALVLAAIVVIGYPQCLSVPYSDLDERLQTYWLSGIGEAQPVWSIWLNDPVSFAKYYATPLAALAVLTANIFQNVPRQKTLIAGCFLLVSVLVSFWQVRGGNFALAFSVIPLAVWVGEKRSQAGQGTRAMLAMVFAWVVSLNACWTLAAQSLRDLTSPAPAVAGQSANVAFNETDCYRAADFAGLAKLEPGVVAAVSNIGPAMLKHAPHRVLAGPYHRNIAGNIANLDVLMAGPEEAWQAASRNGVTIVAHCPGNDESSFLARSAPGGLLAMLMRNEAPQWLVPADDGGNSSIRLYRVQPK
ncbi:MAG: GtrA family protein [Rhizobiaceae bacterium]